MAIKDEPVTSTERICAMVVGGCIVIGALVIDGLQAQTMAIAVAGGLFGLGGYAIGRVKRK